MAPGAQDDGELEVPWPVDYEPPAPGTSPQYRHEPWHVGVAPPGTSIGQGEMRVEWQTPPLAIGTYSASKSSPVLDEDTLYIGVDDGHLHALDLETGDIRWSFRTDIYDYEVEREDDNNRGIHGTAAVDDEMVYVGEYLGRLYAVDKTDGTLVWKVDLGGSIGASAALYGGYLFVSVEFSNPADGKMFVVQASDGEVVYESPSMGGHPHSSTSIDPNRGYMFAGGNNGKFWCFDFVNKEEVWSFQMDMGADGDIKSTPAVAEDTVYVTSWDHKLHAIDIDSGEEIFEVETLNRTMSSPSVYEDTVYFGSHDGRLYAVDAHDGTEKWVFDTGRTILSSPTIVPETGAVLIGSNNSNLYVIDMETGELRWDTTLNGVVSSVPTAAGDALYLFDGSGTVWKFVDAVGPGNAGG